jgi:hypothetical protein
MDRKQINHQPVIILQWQADAVFSREDAGVLLQWAGVAAARVERPPPLHFFIIQAGHELVSQRLQRAIRPTTVNTTSVTESLMQSDAHKKMWVKRSRTTQHDVKFTAHVTVGSTNSMWLLLCTGQRLIVAQPNLAWNYSVTNSLRSAEENVAL